MPRSAISLRTSDRACLGALCLLLTLSLSMRVFTYRDDTAGSEPGSEAAAVDLGAGVVLTRADAVHREVWIATCPLPVKADFVEPSPHGTDASLVTPRDRDDRVVYVYRGWTLEGPRAAMKLSVLYFLNRAAAVLHLSLASVRSELAVKLVLPAGCAVMPEDALAALRRHS